MTIAKANKTTYYPEGRIKNPTVIARYARARNVLQIVVFFETKRLPAFLLGLQLTGLACDRQQHT